ncbi:MAG: S8 family serine peptidase [archaeon]
MVLAFYLMVLLHLRFDEPTKLGMDTSGRINKVSVSSSSKIKSLPGKLSGAVVFSGVGGYITITDSANLRINQSSTILFWIKPSRLGALANGSIIDKIKVVKNNVTGYGLDIGNEGVLFKFSTKNIGENNKLLEVRTSNSLSLNQWHQIGVVMGSNNASLYVDGALQSSTEFSGKIQSGDKISMKIAKGYLSSSKYFNGSIDEFRIYNRSLTESEIQQDYSKLGDCGSVASGNCSEDKKYCSGGVLISGGEDTCSLCGCAEGYVCFADETCRPTICKPGIKRCNNNKIETCYNSGTEWVITSSCSVNQGCNSSTFLCDNLPCDDGTPYSTCSTTKPLFCQNKILVNRSSLCGCAVGYRSSSEKCVEDIIGGVYLGVATIKKNYFVGDLIQLTDPPQTETPIDDGIIAPEKEVTTSVGDIQETETIVSENAALTDITPGENAAVVSEVIVPRVTTTYLIELKEISLGDVKDSIDKEVSAINEKSEVAKQQATKLVSSAKVKKIKEVDTLKSEAVSKKKSINDSFKVQKDKISLEHKNFIDNVKNKKYEKNVLKKISGMAIFGNVLGIFTGKVVSEPSVVVLGELSSIINGVILNISAEEAEKLKNLPEVKGVFPIYESQALLDKSVPLINANDVWLTRDSQARTITGKGVRVAVIDSGIDFNNPEFGRCTQLQFESGNCPKIAGGWDYCSDNVNCFSEDSFPDDRDGHGTHVAGIIAANKTLKGVAPDSILYIYKILNSSGSDPNGRLLVALEDIYNRHINGQVRIDVLSISIGGTCRGGYSSVCGPDDIESLLIDRLVNDAGVVVVIAAGNNGSSVAAIGSPGTARNAITVGSVYKQDYQSTSGGILGTDTVVRSSSRGPVVISGTKEVVNKPDVVAPGAIICSARYDSITSLLSSAQPCAETYHIAMSGTSMATPMVSGVAALIKQAYPTMTALEIKELIKNNAKYLSGFGPSDQGAGRVDALAAISIIKSKMVNNLPYSVSGNLRMVLQKYSGGFWKDSPAGVPVIDISQTIGSGETIALDKIWNGESVRAVDVGTYRVSVSFNVSGQIARNYGSDFFVFAA